MSPASNFVGNTGELAIAGPNLALWHYDTAKCCNFSLAPPGDGGLTLSANPHNPAKFVAVTYNGVYILTVDRSGKPHKALLSSQSANDALFSPDGTEVVITGYDGSVKIYRVATGKIVATLSAHGTTAMHAAFSPDGKQIVAGYRDGTVRVWDVATTLQLTLLAGHTGSITSVQFSPDGRQIATASDDGTIRVWYAEPRELRTEFTIPDNLRRVGSAKPSTSPAESSPPFPETSSCTRPAANYRPPSNREREQGR